MSSPKVYPSEQGVKHGNTVEFECIFKDDIVWKLNNKPLPPNVKEIHDKNSSIHYIIISNTTRGNIGKYRCEFNDHENHIIMYDIGVLKYNALVEYEYEFNRNEMELADVLCKDYQYVTLFNFNEGLIMYVEIIILY